MSFVKTVDETGATGDVAVLYDRLRGPDGLPNWALLFSLKPGVLDGWTALLGAVKDGQDPRRYELATIGAARALSSSYCLLAHGEVLLGLGVDPETLREVAQDGDAPALSPTDRAVIAFAAHIATDASSVTAEEVATLHALGLTDAEIFDIAATAAARCFFSKLLDAMGAEPDARFNDLPDALRAALVRGRPIAG